MTKEEVSQRVYKDGKPLDLDLFTWCEETNTFETEEHYLLINFKEIDNCNFKIQCDTQIMTGSYCTFKAGGGCTFSTGSHCTFHTEEYCDFITAGNCNFYTSYGCIFNVEDRCSFKTGKSCVFTVLNDGFFRVKEGCVIIKKNSYSDIDLILTPSKKINAIRIEP